MGFRRAGAIAALVGGFSGALGANSAPPAASPSAAFPHLPAPVSVAHDTPELVSQRQRAVAGSMFDVQTYLRSELEAAYPQLQGTLAYMPYKPDGTYLEGGHEFAAQVLEQYHRSPLGQRISARTDVDHILIDNVVRFQAVAKYEAELAKDRWEDNLGYFETGQIIIPVDRGEHIYRFGIIGLLDKCQSCVQAKPEPAGTECRKTHPDTVFEERTERLNVGFHELSHHIYHFLGLRVVRTTLGVSHTTEIDADMFGTFMQIRIFGSSHEPKMLAMLDANTNTANSHLYFNPRAFGEAANWIAENTPAKLQQMSLREVYELSHRLAVATALPDEEISQLAAHHGRAAKSKDTAAERVNAYNRQSRRALTPGKIKVGGKTYDYSPIAYQYDLARLRNAAAGGNYYANQLAQVNPLRDPRLAGNSRGQMDTTSTAQVSALNMFNRTLYGDKACVVPLPAASGLRP